MTRDEQILLLSYLESFVDEGYIGNDFTFVKGGKEATVFRCAAGPRARSVSGYLAAKVYRPQKYRRFHNDAGYNDGRVITKHRERRAFEKRTEFGQQVHYHLWVQSEFDTQRALHAAGAGIPRPIATNGTTILMEWVGDGAEPALQLKDARIDPRDAPRVLGRILSDVELLLAHNVVHGDLSPFNILYHHGAPILIDFPQAVDARTNANAMNLLYRDVENVCRFFRTRHSIDRDAYKFAGWLWGRYRRAEL